MARAPVAWRVGDVVRLPRIDFTGHVIGVVATRDPVVTVRSTSGATLTMSASQLDREHEGDQKGQA